MDAADVFVSRLMDEEEKEEPTVSTKTTPPSSAPSHPHGHAEVLWYYQDPQGNVQGNLVSNFGQDNTTLFLYSSTVRAFAKFCRRIDFLQLNCD